ncbi:hypothetical protein NKH18_45195 [Streptomyces sp. M10(2022)]
MAEVSLSSTMLDALVHEIFSGGHSFSFSTDGGALVATDSQVKLLGYIHADKEYPLEYLGRIDPEAKQDTYADSEITTTDSASRGSGSSFTHATGGSLSGGYAGAADSTVASGTVSGGRSVTEARSTTVTDSASVTRLSSDWHNDFHAFRVTATFLLVADSGHRNAAENLIGLGRGRQVANAVTVPGPWSYGPRAGRSRMTRHCPQRWAGFSRSHPSTTSFRDTSPSREDVHWGSPPSPTPSPKTASTPSPP